METEQQPKDIKQVQEKQQQSTITKKQDLNSVFLQNVDYGSTKQQLQSLFEDCGDIVRVTILKDRYTNLPRGNAYIEFKDTQAVEHALVLSGIKLRNRIIKVQQKRTNVKGMAKKNYHDPNIFNLGLMNIFGRGRGSWRGRGR